MAYGEKVLDHYENPRNVGVLDKDAKNVGTGMVGAPASPQEVAKYSLMLLIFWVEIFKKQQDAGRLPPDITCKLIELIEVPPKIQIIISDIRNEA